ncbi:MAG: hypothetical protein ACD_30C00005G0046 [uncultured bacterium]|uniref:Peptidyl-prolyl cis-trans isomerase n=2 Tax=Candidatus Daviesiibacteriota TaxID=1752718 RepID=A0A0G0ET77_9BACT|nr:MAG: hypothetical protein ACD_30C00005G0046 [uncultured bacterium]KKQ08722.1 MAG: Peptidyl-prolyl cis-trans isomerase [Candidatus Daviesbacteria bacterium GW2011_GWB1_36_5]KKQ15878.1 MAG: Peptidyl-prolyl cis-trans isomerase [Candidatus Daviesbacteria bacterium GW2011_GWA1_36_8]
MSERVFVVIFLVVVALVSVGLLVSRSMQNNQVNQSAQSANTISPPPSAAGQVSQTPVPTPLRKTYTAYTGDVTLKERQNKKAVIQTKKGTIEFEIYPEATKAASNFIKLTNDGFYDGITFHRVEPGFVIQGGDPEGTGRGGPGYKFEDEPVTKKYIKGIVAMANAGPDTNGSQFFIMLEDKLDLPPKYTIFGKVIKGQEVVSAIRVGDVMEKVTIENLR